MPCLDWNALHGFVLVRLLEGDLHSRATMSENNVLAKHVSQELYTSVVIAITIDVSYKQLL